MRRRLRSEPWASGAKCPRAYRSGGVAGPREAGAEVAVLEPVAVALRLMSSAWGMRRSTIATAGHVVQAADQDVADAAVA
jgi:hypothetical protein